MRSRLPRGPAVDVLAGAGHTATEDTTRRIRSTLQAAATGGAADRQALWIRTLDRDLDVAGFGGVGNPRMTPQTLQHPRTAPSAERIDDPTIGARTGRRRLERSGRRAGPSATKAKLHTAAERAREAADAKRHQADRLSDEARTAADEATIAEHAADAAEEAARAARAAIRRSR